MRKKIVIFISFLLLISTIFTGCVEDNVKKPVIYLYPTNEQIISVKLDFNGDLTCTYPAYMDGWQVKAQPNGTLTNLADGREYSYLYWEGTSNIKYDMSKGFVVKGSDTETFLQEKLAYIGLNPREYNEFIVYWLPILQENKYNLITFAGEEYENNAKLEINPKPDSILRVMMVFKPLNKYQEVEPQELKPFVREGFTVVEWGGTEQN
jgi:hypothetical protein